jgi:hypothetical protein
VACLAKVAMATLGRQLTWYRRALTPALTFVVLSIVQVAVWDTLVIPVLTGPPLFQL